MIVFKHDDLFSAFDFNKLFTFNDDFGKVGEASKFEYRVDTINGGDTIRISSELAGLQQDGLSISMNERNGTVNVKGKRECLSGESRAFEKSFPYLSYKDAPFTVESTSANYSRGILSIFINKSKVCNPKLKNIPVNFHD